MRCYPFEQKSGENNDTKPILLSSAVVTATADSSRVKLFVHKARSVMDAGVAKKELKKKAGLKKQLSKSNEKMSVIKKQKNHRITISSVLKNTICKKLFVREKKVCRFNFWFV